MGMPRMQPVRFDPGSAAKEMKDSLNGWQTRIRQFCDEFQRKISNLPQTNYDLGLGFAKQGLVKEAIFRFKLALYFAPNFPQAWYNLGCCQLANGDKARAVESLQKALKQKPDHTDAKFMLATIDPNLLPVQSRPTRMPHHMMEGFFARIATQYDMLEGQLQYAGPQVMHQRVRGLLGRGDIRLLDLGCGTGLSGYPWRKEATHTVGVDVTPQMAAIARNATLEGVNVYNEVLVADANAQPFLLTETGFDAVIALNVLPFVGEAQAFIMNAAKACKAGGYVALTHDPYNGQGGYGILPETGKFGHSVDYLRQLGQAAGLTPVSQEAIALYPESKTSLLFFTKAGA